MNTPGRPGRRAGVIALGAALVAMSLSGCSEEVQRGFLPKGATEGAQRVTDLWVGGWLAAIAVGGLTYGLAIWSIIRYRRKRGETGLPVQLRYNVPIEILYTVLPIMMVGTLFYFTARDEAILLDTTAKPDVQVNVVGKRWSWDFNYWGYDVHESGRQADFTGQTGVRDELPVMYLPVNKRIEFVLTSRDVIHSFWVPAFQQKLDMIPGKVNKFQVVTTQTGDFDGKCAELCGSYHANMLFRVKVVSMEEFEKQMAALKSAGKTGYLDTVGLSPAKLEPGQEKIAPSVGSNN